MVQLLNFLIVSDAFEIDYSFYLPQNHFAFAIFKSYYSLVLKCDFQSLICSKVLDLCSNIVGCSLNQWGCSTIHKTVGY